MNVTAKLQISGMPKRVQIALLKVVEARARWQTVDEMDRETMKEILNENVFTEEESGDRITEPFGDFMMSETDFTRYSELVYARNLEKGLDSGGVGITFWEVHKALYDAEDAYIDAVAADIPALTPEQVQQLKSSPKWREEFFRITGIESVRA